MSLYAVISITDDKVECAPRLYKTRRRAYRRGVDDFLKGCSEIIVVDVMWEELDDVFLSLDELADALYPRK